MNDKEASRLKIISNHLNSQNLTVSPQLEANETVSGSKISISSHVLDQNNGKPAQGVPVVLSRFDGEKFLTIAKGVTNQDGRVTKDSWEWQWSGPTVRLTSEVFQATFQCGDYYQNKNIETLYPYVPIVFKLKQREGHYHIPLLLSPFGYSTYRGS
ncbi:5-hydroxyisourate hydrolase [Acrasis kona]|uniref:5-hydroxyisourate hydrolase n=1 Tax=Acrasis kona TaxID=1008807 RepID=A0AAW2Z1N3_9EUKA